MSATHRTEPEAGWAPDRAALAQARPAWIHVGRRVSQPDVAAFEIDGRRCVVKDFRPRPRAVRRTWGRWVLRREWRLLERLQGLSGIPRLLGWVDPDAFAMEWLDAERLPVRKEEGVAPVVCERLAELVGAMHARGVGHGDLRRKNILVDRDGRPYLIDFATACVARRGRLGRAWFARLCAIDRLTVLKLKRYYCPDAVTPEEAAQLEATPFVLRLGRLLRKKVYRPLKPRRLRRRWERVRSLFGK